MGHEVVIYTASADDAGFYDRSKGRAGGAERQMMLLARSLTERGHRVAHIVYPTHNPVALSYPLTLVTRAPSAGDPPLIGGVLEALRVWRALRAADANVVIVRTASPALSIAAAFCRMHRRALVFSSSNVSDFTLERMGSRLNRVLFRFGVRHADAVVVQSNDQVALARRAFPSLRRLVQIPSLAETTSPSLSDGHRHGAFVWFARLVAEKQAMRYVELARAVPEARFVMIPLGEFAGPGEYEALLEAARTVPNLELRDALPHDQLTQLVARAVAVVNTSTSEGMPNSFLEAWAHGIPVLTLQFDPDAVVAQHGLGVSADGSWERFVDGARELWEGRDRRQELAGRVRGYVEQTHSIEAVTARWSDLIREVATPR